MIAFFLAVSLSIPMADAATSNSPTPDKSASRRFIDIEAELSTALRKEATSKTASDRSAAIQELAALHREIVRDTRFATSDTLKEYRGKIAVRLIAVKNELKRKLANQAEADRRRSSKPVALNPQTLSPTEIENVISTNVALVSMSLGGPVQTFTQTRGAFGGGIMDDGQALVDLIEATINPKFWDVNGGPGTIIYFAPLRCLVVRATDEVHHNVGGVVGALRAAGQ